MFSQLILAWKNHYTHEWVPVGKLSFSKKKYYFQYTKKAKTMFEEGEFAPFSHMTLMDLIYESEELFPIFKNRLLQKSRPEYQDYLSWLHLSSSTVSPIEELARSGGIRGTDDLQLFPYPEEKDGNYEVTFFSHGIRHLPSSYINRLNDLGEGEKLYIMVDIQNKFDPHALVLRTEDPIEIVGYVPRFFSFDFNSLIKSNGQKNVIVTVEKINLNSPSQFRLLCQFKTLWPNDFKPFEAEEFI